MLILRSDPSTKNDTDKQGLGMNKLVELFCDVDDFCKVFIPQWENQLLEEGTRKRNRHGRMTTSEIMTIVVYFHMSQSRDFKNYYIGYVSRFHRQDFPNFLLEVSASRLNASTTNSAFLVFISKKTVSLPKPEFRKLEFATVRMAS